jgi:hypothetical protein
VHELIYVTGIQARVGDVALETGGAGMVDCNIRGDVNGFMDLQVFYHIFDE